jgi:hypothetical protein
MPYLQLADFMDGYKEERLDDSPSKRDETRAKTISSPKPGRFAPQGRFAPNWTSGRQLA